MDFKFGAKKAIFTSSQVKYWITINEPWIIAVLGYHYPVKAPGVADPNGTYLYIAGHTILKAHAAVYHLYDEEYRAKQNGTRLLLLRVRSK